MAKGQLSSHLFSGSWKARARWALRIITPWGIEWWLWERGRRRAERTEILATPRPEPRVEEVFGFLVARGLDEHAVRAGSVPGAALQYIGATVFDRLPEGRPVRVLHIGNFVGVSLCYFSWLVHARHPESTVVSIDPNIPHRGVENPEGHVRALLGRYALLDSNLIIRGYTLEAPPGESAVLASPENGASENVLPALQRIAPRSFDLLFVDGDHTASHVAREFAALSGLLADNAIVVFDDVVDWSGVSEVFAEALGDERFSQLGQDGRVGIVRLEPGKPAAVAPT